MAMAETFWEIVDGECRNCDSCGKSQPIGATVKYVANGNLIESLTCAACEGNTPSWSERLVPYSGHKAYYLLGLLRDLRPVLECPGKQNIMQTKHGRVLELRSMADEIEQDLTANGYHL